MSPLRKVQITQFLAKMGVLLIRRVEFLNSEPISQREFFRESVKRLFGADSILKGKLAKETEYMVRTYAAQLKAEVIELNVQIDHVHLLAMIPPKVSISKFMGVIKGKAAIRILNKYKDLRMEPYWGNHFWTRGYCVDTVDLIRR